MFPDSKAKRIDQNIHNSIRLVESSWSESEVRASMPCPFGSSRLRLVRTGRRKDEQQQQLHDSAYGDVRLESQRVELTVAGHWNRERGAGREFQQRSDVGVVGAIQRWRSDDDDDLAKSKDIDKCKVGAGVLGEEGPRDA